jgi:hypothetical protein
MRANHISQSRNSKSPPVLKRLDPAVDAPTGRAGHGPYFSLLRDSRERLRVSPSMYFRSPPTGMP